MEGFWGSLTIYDHVYVHFPPKILLSIGADYWPFIYIHVVVPEWEIHYIFINILTKSINDFFFGVIHFYWVKILSISIYCSVLKKIFFYFMANFWMHWVLKKYPELLRKLILFYRIRTINNYSTFLLFVFNRLCICMWIINH